MTAAEVLAAIEERARTYSGLGFEHEGDCAGSLCTSCGHCLHTVDADGCKCADCGCIVAVDDDEVLMKRDTLRAVAALQAVLALADEVADAPRAAQWVHRNRIQDAINAALGVEP